MFNFNCLNFKFLLQCSGFEGLRPSSPGLRPGDEGHPFPHHVYQPHSFIFGKPYALKIYMLYRHSTQLSFASYRANTTILNSFAALTYKGNNPGCPGVYSINSRMQRGIYCDINPDCEAGGIYAI